MSTVRWRSGFGECCIQPGYRRNEPHRFRPFGGWSGGIGRNPKLTSPICATSTLYPLRPLLDPGQKARPQPGIRFFCDNDWRDRPRTHPRASALARLRHYRSTSFVRPLPDRCQPRKVDNGSFRAMNASEIASLLRKQICSGHFLLNEKLPTQRTLASHLMKEHLETARRSLIAVAIPSTTPARTTF